MGTGKQWEQDKGQLRIVWEGPRGRCRPRLGGGGSWGSGPTWEGAQRKGERKGPRACEGRKLENRDELKLYRQNSFYRVIAERLLRAPVQRAGVGNRFWLILTLFISRGLEERCWGWSFWPAWGPGVAT